MINLSDGNYSITKFKKCNKHLVDLKKISAISKLSWRAMEKNYSLNEYENDLIKITSTPKQYSPIIIAIGAGFACGGFCK